MSEGHLIANNLVLGGSASNNAAVAVYNTGTGTSVEEVTVANNIVRRTTDGNAIRIQKISHATVMGNRVRGTLTDKTGIFGNEGAQHLYVGNAGNTVGGATLATQGVANALVVGNYSAGAGGLSAAPTGFGFAKSSLATENSRIALIGNYAQSAFAGSRGIQTADTIDHLFVAANDVHHNMADGFNLQSTGTPGVKRYANWQLISTSVLATEHFDGILLGSLTNAQLTGGTNASLWYCSDCDPATGTVATCAGAGTGSFAARVSGGTMCVQQ